MNVGLQTNTRLLAEFAEEQKKIVLSNLKQYEVSSGLFLESQGN